MATRTVLASFLCLALLTGAAPGRGGPAEARARFEAMPLLELYAIAYSAGAIAFSCTPAVYPGGRERPGYESMRRKLRKRRMRVRGRLIALYGVGAIQEIERAHADEEHGIYRTGCDRNATPTGRARYRRLIETLERRTAGP